MKSLVILIGIIIFFKNMSFEHPGFEARKEKTKEQTKEKFEKEGEKIAEERGGFFARVVERVLEEREEVGKSILNAGETSQLVVDKLKKIPIANGVVVSLQGVAGAEYGKQGKPNRKLDTKESMVKCGTGALIAVKEALEIREQFKTGEKPSNILSGEVLKWLENKANKREQEHPGGKSAKAMRIIHKYFRDNENLLLHFEDKLNKAAAA